MTHPIDTSPEAIAALLDELRTIGCFKNGDARCTCGIGQNAADLIQALTAERDEARAQVAMAYEVAATVCSGVIKDYDVMKPDGVTYENIKVQKASKGLVSIAREDIRALTPSDATAALARRDAAMRNEGRRQVKVKPLVWELFCDQSNKRREFAHNGHGASYHVSDEGWWLPLRPLHACNGIVASKAAAQADYEARILAALEPEGGE